MQALAPLLFAVTLAVAGVTAAVSPVSAQSVSAQSVSAQPVASATR